jgi:hypothetical protein
MKTFVTTAAALALLTGPVFAQGSTTGSESRGEPQASSAKESAKDPAEKDAKGAMGQGQMPRATTGAASDPKDPSKDTAGTGSTTAPKEKTGVTGGGDTGGGGGGSGGGSAK